MPQDDAVEREVGATGSDATPMACDLAKEDAIRALIDKIVAVLEPTGAKLFSGMLAAN